MRRKKKEIISRLAAVQLICLHYIDDPVALEKLTDNLATVVYMIRGIKGLDEVKDILEGYRKASKMRFKDDEA